MCRSRYILLLLVAFPLGLFASSAGGAEKESVTKVDPKQQAEHARFFEKQVRPILVARCFKCHGEKKQEASLRLDSRAAVLKGSDSGSIVIAGQPGKSPLIKAINYGSDVEMPPKEKLSEAEIRVLTRWVELGMPWPEVAGTKKALNDAEQLVKIRREHWSFQPPIRPALPQIKNRAWVRMPLDFFVASLQEAHQLSPSPPIDRRTLIRRATMDLIGIPPSVEQVDAFLADTTPGAYSRLIDRLLASPQHGERWGRHWLDVARYSDTRGYAFARERRFPYAYTYRDYVIRALNEDLPFNRFIVEQIAADKLELGEDRRALAAMGFLTVGRRYNNVHEDIDDRIDVVSRGLLGLTVGCARCHDHKYDPIPMADYYSLYGVFASSTEPKDPPEIGTPANLAAYKKYQSELVTVKKSLEDFADARLKEIEDMSRRRVTDYLARVIASEPEEILLKMPFISLGKDELKPRVLRAWRGYLARRKPDEPIFGSWCQLLKLPKENFAAEATKIIAELETDNHVNPLVRDALKANPPKSRIELARVYGKLLEHIYNESKVETKSASIKALRNVLLDDGSPTRIKRTDLVGYLDRENRNQYRALQVKVDRHSVNSPGSPPRPMMLIDKPKPFDPYIFLRGKAHRHGKSVPRQMPRAVVGENQKPFISGSGRLELARAIASPDNPLTARVFVNRVWMHHFGVPLVATPSDFGVRAPRPRQLQMLNYLAAEFRDSGWSVKQLHRLIMLSATYRQSSVDRPDCRKIDPDNSLLWRANRRRLEFESVRDALLSVAGQLDLKVGGRPINILAQPFSRRRTVYALVDRQDLPNLFRVFDFASPDQTAPKRPNTTVPQQVLFLINSPFVIEQAEHLLVREEIVTKQTTSEKIQAFYRIVYGRAASADEVDLATRFVVAAGNNESAWKQFSQALLISNEFMFVD